MELSKAVLMIDDDKDDQEFFIAALQGIPNVGSVRITGNGREALDLLNSNLFLPDIIFSDLNMPVMNGIEWLAENAKCPNTKNIPVVILSSGVEMKEIAFALGAKSFIKKNSDLKMLTLEIAQMINRDFADEDVLRTSCTSI